jgi:hypothetical protein
MLRPCMCSRGSNNQRKDLRGMRPELEGLERRLLLYSALGDQWTYTSRITYSFMPDGTSVGGVSSTLFQTLDAKFPTTTWEQQIETAASLWENVTNVNLALVPDGGEPVGAAGDQQGDPRFGDIRIGAVPLGSSVLAVTFVPPPGNGGTEAGDILLNSSVDWEIDSNYDLMTVVAHEFGHALGLGESTVSTAVMYGTYNGIKQELATDDISGIQSIYGSRQFDQFNLGSQRDNSYTTATNINSYMSNNQIALPGLDITTAGDSEWFHVNVPATSTGTMTVAVQSSNLSSLSPKLQVYNSSLSLVGTAGTVGSFGATASVSTSVEPGQGYYIKVLAAGGPGPIGGYGLLVNFGSQTQASIPSPDTVVPEQPSQGGGTSNDNAPTSSPSGLLEDLGLMNVIGTLTGLVEVMSTSPDLVTSVAGALLTQTSGTLTALQAVAISIAGMPASTPDTDVVQPANENTGTQSTPSGGASPALAVLQAIDQAIDDDNLLDDGASIG